MTVLQFIASIAGSLVWPVVIVLVALIFRKPLVQLILSLRKFSYSGLELNFGIEVAELEAAADRAKVPDVLPEKAGARGGEVPTSARGVGGIPDEQILKIAESNPVAAVILAWSQVEREIQAAMTRLAISPSFSEHASVNGNIRLLQSSGYIDEDISRILASMLDLRNQLAHGSVKRTEITFVEAIEYIRLAKRMIQKLALSRK